MKLLCGLLLLFFITTPCFAQTEVRTVGPQKPDDASYSFFINLLNKALGSQYQIVTIPNAGQGRSLELMFQGKFYDVLWTGEDQERNNKLLRVAFPLFQGGLGIRGAIIQQQFKSTYSQINSLNLLKNLRICQGNKWPDADILEGAELTVFRVVHFDSMLKMIDLGRCDIFPLSIFEGQGELDLVSNRYPNLIFSTDVLLSYPINMYFYVVKEKPKLAAHLETRLKALKASGEYESFLQKQPLTSNAFPLNKYRNSKIIEVIPGNQFLQHIHK